MKIGILYICTGKYSIFWKDFYLSMEKYFIPEAEKNYFVFTDAENIDFEKENPKIHKIYQENLGWPGNTLKRFHIFLKDENIYSNMDYLFFFNANLLILEEIKADDFLPNEEERLVATIHPGFFNKKRSKFTYDDNIKSTAFVNKKEGKYYFAGGLNGGKTKDFINAMKEMMKNTETDSNNGVVAKWHDESHWNKYLINKDYIKKLSPSYLYPEGWKIPFPKIILIRDKNKHGGHNQLRDIHNNKNFSFKEKIKKIFYKIIFLYRS